MSAIVRNPRKLLIAAALLVVLVLLLLYIGYPAALAVATVAPDGDTSPAPPDGFTDVTLLTSDGVSLTGWYAAPTNGAAIILLHGAGSGRDSVRTYALRLYENGFGVLAVSLRGYDDSAGRINRLGWRATLDIGAAVDYLAQRAEVRMIGGLGLSMGGESLLGAASTYPTVRALISDGATYRATNEYTALPENQPLYRHFTHTVFSFMVQLFSGDDLPQPTIMESITAAETTSILFIAAGNDETEIAYNQMYHDAIGDRASLWVISGVGHTGGFDHDPETYLQNVIAFFSRTLLDAA